MILGDGAVQVIASGIEVVTSRVDGTFEVGAILGDFILRRLQLLLLVGKLRLEFKVFLIHGGVPLYDMAPRVEALWLGRRCWRGFRGLRDDIGGKYGFSRMRRSR